MTDRVTLILLQPDGTRDKRPLRSHVGVPRKNELLWVGEEPWLVVEVEYAVVEGFFGGMSVEAAGVYARPLSAEEQAAVARRLEVAPRGQDDRPFRP
jgi:hypothetical protein